MSQRWKSMRVPAGKTGKRSAAAAGALAGMRAAIKAQNRRVQPRARSGISSTSVFQAGTHRPELKFLDVTTNGVIAFGATVGNLTLLNGCAQGTDAVQHIGRQTTMKSIYWEFRAAFAATTTGAGSVRLVIVYDKEAEGAAPTIAAAAQTDIFNQDTIVAQMNLNNRDRFIVLVDEVIECIGASGPASFFRKGYRKIDLPCVFNASAAATVAAINTGSVYACVWQDGAILTASPGSTLQTRIRFVDA